MVVAVGIDKMVVGVDINEMTVAVDIDEVAGEAMDAAFASCTV